jgi:hypothetical protein
MKPSKHTALKAEWPSIRPGDYSSPSKDAGDNQMVLFERPIKDGEIKADVTPVDGQRDDHHGYQLNECCFVVRHRSDRYYIAGIGGFGRKFFIAKVAGAQWTALAVDGDVQSLRADTVYPLRLEFLNERFTLFHNDVPVLTANDRDLDGGLCGLRVNKTEARFANVDIETVKRKCFVIMPFHTDLTAVYGVIKDTIERHDFNCSRADERFVSEPIMEDVKNQIEAADLVVVDFTGRNPNVYFEAGLAEAHKKKLIVLAQSKEDVAFDVQHIRYLLYSNRMRGDVQLREMLERAITEMSQEPPSPWAERQPL